MVECVGEEEDSAFIWRRKIARLYGVEHVAWSGDGMEKCARRVERITRA
jgi:hypothetical protein